MYIKTQGLVLRENAYKESSRMLTVLTSTEGKITVSARGAKRRGSKTAASSQLLAFSDMTLFHDRGRYVLTEARSIELFLGLREDLNLLSLGMYFAELLEAMSDEDMPNPELLSLGLNGLYALSEGKNLPKLIKAAFELRLMCIAGFEPILDGCMICGKQDMKSPVLSLSGGGVRCAECGDGTDERLALTSGMLSAMRYITGSDAKKIYGFTVGQETADGLSKVCESYLLTQLGGHFSSLDFYHSLI